MKTLLSLFDYSGEWARPYQEAGWNVILWDIKHDADNVMTFAEIHQACADFFYENIFDNYGTIDGVLIAAPCTDFSSSGAQYWKAKDEDGRTKESLELVNLSMKIVDLCKPYFWAIENPVGRLQKLVPELGKPWYFQPHWYGDSYTKKTGLWGVFGKPEKKNEVEPIKYCNQGSWLQQLGGKSDKTKELRSITPKGFAEAFYKANNDFSHIQDLDMFFDMYDMFYNHFENREENKHLVEKESIIKNEESLLSKLMEYSEKKKYKISI